MHSYDDIKNEHRSRNKTNIFRVYSIGTGFKIIATAFLLSISTSSISDTQYNISDAFQIGKSDIGPAVDIHALCLDWNRIYLSFCEIYGGCGCWNHVGIVANEENYDGEIIPLGCAFELCDTDGNGNEPRYIGVVYENFRHYHKPELKISIVPETNTISPKNISEKTDAFAKFVVRVTDEFGLDYNNVAINYTIERASELAGHSHLIPPVQKELFGSVTYQDNDGLSMSTDSDVGIQGVYTASEISGTYILKVECAGLDCGTASTEFYVGVDGLDKLGASDLWILIGITASHPENHYISSDAKIILEQLAIKYLDEISIADPVYLNDISLVKGGLFDIGTNGKWWSSPHFEHRNGTVVDIRANEAPGAVKQESFEDFIELVESLGADILLERKYDKTTGQEIISLRHFHVRLTGVKG